MCTLQDGRDGSAEEGRNFSSFSEGQAPACSYGLCTHLHHAPLPTHTQVTRLRKKHTSVPFFNKHLSLSCIPWIISRATNTAENMASKVPSSVNCISQRRRLTDRQKTRPTIPQFWAVTSVTGFLVAQTVKHLPVMRETWVRSLVGKIPWRRQWQPTPVFLPGESHGWKSLGGQSPWGRRVGRSWATSLVKQVLWRRIKQKTRLRMGGFFLNMVVKGRLRLRQAK